MATANTYYYELRDILKDLQVLISRTNRLSNIIKKIPKDLQTSEDVSFYRRLINNSSLSYTSLRRRISRKLRSYIEAEDEAVVERQKIYPGASDYKFFIDTLLPKRFSVLAKSNSVDNILTLLEGFKNVLIEAVLEAKRVLNSYLGYGIIKDKKAKRLKERVDTALDDPEVYTTVMDKNITIEQKQQLLTSHSQKVKEEISTVFSKIENVLDTGSLADIDLNQESPAVVKFLKKMGELNRSPVTPKSFSEDLEGYWREIIRAKFGGDLPFCDEVAVDGTPVKVQGKFTKYKDVLDLGNGVFVLKKDTIADTVRKILKDKNEEAY